MYDQCEANNFPLHTLIRIDDDATQRSAYLQFTKADFQFNSFSAGSKLQRQAYNITPDIKKYFSKRKFLFSLFDDGIQIDRQSWYSVVPEPVSLYLGEQLKYYGVKTIMEPFCGVGGIAIQICDGFKSYTVNDIDEKKIAMLKNNLTVYGKGLNQIKIKNKDIFELQPFKVDAVIACPPWGGLELDQYSYKDLDEIMNPKLSHILLHCMKFSQNIILQMPKNTNISNLVKTINLCFIKPLIKIEKIQINEKLSQLLVYLGDEEFLHLNPKVYETILRDGGLLVTGVMRKQQKKDLKEKLGKGQIEIFHTIYQISKKKKHIFFDEGCKKQE